MKKILILISLICCYSFALGCNDRIPVLSINIYVGQIFTFDKSYGFSLKITSIIPYAGSENNYQTSLTQHTAFAESRGSDKYGVRIVEVLDTQGHYNHKYYNATRVTNHCQGNGTCGTPPPLCTLLTQEEISGKCYTKCPLGTTRNTDKVCTTDRGFNPPDTCKSQVGSYVVPYNQSFHEDIEILGSNVGLHYSSLYTSANSDSNASVGVLSSGWDIDIHNRLFGTTLYKGNGEIVKDIVVSSEADETLVKDNTLQYHFDVNGLHVKTSQLLTGSILYSFAYDESNKLTSITDVNTKSLTLNYVSGVLDSIDSDSLQTTSLSIDANNHITSISYPNSEAYTFVYNANGLMSEETEPKGNSFTHLFDAKGLVTSVSDSEGGVYGYSKVDNNSSSSTIAYPESENVVYTNSPLVNGKYVSTITYPTSEIKTITSAQDGSSKTTQSCGVSETKQYGLTHPRLEEPLLSSKQITMPSGLTSTTNYSAVFNSDNETYTITHNGDSSTQYLDYTNKLTESTSPLGKKETYYYDSNMLKVKEHKNPALISTFYEYDTKGNLLHVNKLNRHQYFTYDEHNNLVSTSDNNSTAKVSYAYDLRNRLTTITGIDGRTVSFAYDANGNMGTLNTPTPTTNSFEYNGVNKQTSWQSPQGYLTSYEYDKQRRITNIIRPSGANIKYTYLNGRVSTIQTPEDTINYNYSCQNYPSSISKADESFNFSYDGELLTQITQAGMLNSNFSYTYNNNFLPASFTYAGSTTEYLYNKDNELINSGNFSINRDYENSKITIFDEYYSQTTKLNEYDELKTQEDDTFKIELVRNNRAQIIKKIETIKNQTTIEHNYEYDKNQRLTSSSAITSITYEDAQDETTLGWRVYDSTPEDANISNIYDDEKQSRVIKLEGERTTNGYLLGNWDNTTEKAIKWSMNYNESFVIYISTQTTKGHRYIYYTASDTDKGMHSNGTYIHHGLGVDANNGSWQTFTRDLEADLKEYESDNELISVNAFLIRGSGLVDDIGLLSNGQGKSEVYSYDANGNRLQATIDGVTTTASYTLDDNLEVYGDNTYRYNEDGYLIEKITPNSGTTSYTYNTLGALTEANIIKAHSDKWHVYDKVPNGASIETIYDEDKQSNVIEFKGDRTSNGYRLGYTGDSNPNSWNTTDKTVQWSMNYNDSFVIYISTQTTKGHRYIYYTASDTDKGMHANGTYIHHGLGANVNNGSWQTFTRDLEADLKEYESDNELLSVNGFLIRGNGRVDDISTLSQESQVTLYEDAEQQKEFKIRYYQNALNQRVAKEVDGEITEKYLWADLTTLLAVYDQDDNLVQRFNYANNRMPISMIQDSQTYYLHYDQVGSLRVVSNQQHQIVKEIVYDTYGNILKDTNQSITIPFGFAGGLYDKDTKLTRFGYRDYDSKTGKWTAKDPIGFSGGDTNLYRYVLNDPVNLVDPEGKSPHLLVGIGVGALVGAVTAYVSTPEDGDSWSNAIDGALLGAGSGLAIATGTWTGFFVGTIVDAGNVANACRVKE